MMRFRTGLQGALWSATLALAWPATACAEASVAADLEASVGVWSRDMRLPQDSGIAAATLTSGMRWQPSTPVSAELEVFAVASGNAHTSRGRIDARKAFISLEADRTSLRVGRQISVWGRTDHLNPTDVLSPRDYTTLSTEDDDQRRGLGMARLEVETSETGQLSVYWIPEFRSDRLLIEPPQSLARDNRSWDPGQFAVKFDATGGAVDWSISYFQGRDRVYDFAVSEGELSVRYNTVRSYGADLATTVGGFGLRAEGAYVDTAFNPDTNPLVRRPELWIVAGIDRSIGEGTYVNVQSSLRRVMDNAPVATEFAASRDKIDALRFQQDDTQFGVTANIRRNWGDGRWTAELTALHYVQRSQGVLRAELRRQITSRLTLLARAQSFYGEHGSYFDRIAPASSFTVELRSALW